MCLVLKIVRAAELIAKLRTKETHLSHQQQSQKLPHLQRRMLAYIQILLKMREVEAYNWKYFPKKRNTCMYYSTTITQASG